MHSAAACAGIPSHKPPPPRLPSRWDLLPPSAETCPAPATNLSGAVGAVLEAEAEGHEGDDADDRDRRRHEEDQALGERGSGKGLEGGSETGVRYVVGFE